MPSPFPGMNPFLEQDDVWHDFHHRFAPAAADLIAEQVAPRYIVKIDEHAYIHEIPADERRPLGWPDAFVAPVGPAADGGGTAAAVLEAPVEVLLPAFDVERQPFLEIRDRNGRQVITVIELLSPSNKDRGPDREQYLAKRNDVLSGTANLVEIDLLRGGHRMPHADVAGAEYCVFVSRAAARPRAGVWPIRIRDRLPEVPVPLRAGEPEARLDLRAILDRVYDAARYHLYVYAGTPRPRLSAEDEVWARQFLPAPPAAGA